MFLCMFLLLAAVQFSGCSRSTSECLKVKDWEIIYNSRSGGVDIYKNSLPLCGSVYSSFKYQEKLIKSCDYPNHRISSRKYEDEFGKGYIYIRLSVRILFFLCLFRPFISIRIMTMY